MKKTVKIPSQIKLQTEFFEGYGMAELIKSIIVFIIKKKTISIEPPPKVRPKI